MRPLPWPTPSPAPPPLPSRRPTMAESLLRTTELSRHFGGLTAVNNVSLDFHRGQVHALLGPNGAGKSTFINLLSGDLPPSSGEISLRGQPIEGATPEHISRLGV